MSRPRPLLWTLASFLICAMPALAAVAPDSAGAAVAEAPAPAPEAVATPPDLTGVWNLDAKASDDLKAFAKQVGSLLPAGGRPGGPGGGMGSPGGGMGGPGGGMGGPGGARGGGMPADELGSDAENQGGPPPRGGQGSGGPGAGLARAAQQLLISADGEAIEIVDGAERSETWVPDGASHTQKGPGDQALSRRAAWQDGVLALEQLGGPLSVTRRLRLDDGGRRLLVELSVLDADGKPVTAHLVYEGVR
jgi:hypothetical protein